MLPSVWLSQWKWPGLNRLEHNLIEVPMRNMDRGARVTLMASDMSVREDEGMQWLFLKVIRKRVSKREIDEHLRRAWGCKMWFHIQQMSSCAFQLGLRDMAEYEQLIKAKWDWFQDSILTIKEWTNGQECNFQVLHSMPLVAVFPDLARDL